MDRRERAGDITTALLAMLQGFQSTLWTALPGKIITMRGSDGTHPQTADIQPTIQARVQAPDGSFSWVTMPPLLDCPVFFPHGGGVTMTFPVKPGDECLVVFSSRCIDAWWQQSDIQVQAEYRMHDLSDGFAFVGFSSKPKVIPAISMTTAQFRTDDGNTFMEIDPGSPNQIRAITPGNIIAHAGKDLTATVGGNASATVTGNLQATIDGTTSITSQGAATWNVPSGLTINGNVTVEGWVTASGEGTFNGGHTVSQHTHTQGSDSHGDAEKPTDPPQG